MRRLPVVLAALLAAGSTAPLSAQECNLFCQPVFVAQPGVIIANAVNPPRDAAGNEAESSTEFLFRVTTVVPTTIPRTTLAGIVQWTPFAEDAAGYISNAPAFVYGPVFSLFKVGPLSTTFDVLGLYAPSPNDNSDYKHQLLLELDAGLSLGEMMGPKAPALFRSLSLYAFLAQPMTDLPKEADGDDVYSPLLLFGVTIPIAPLPR